MKGLKPEEVIALIQIAYNTIDIDVNKYVHGFCM